MNFPSFMTIKDFFNYYVAGFLWLCNIGLIYLPINDSPKLMSELDQIQKITEKVSPLIMGLFVFIFPYVIGFAMTPVSTIFTWLLRLVFGDPKKWVVDYQSNSKWFLWLHKGRRLSKTNIRLVNQRLKIIYGNEKEIADEKISKWFFQIRATVLNQKGEAGMLASRAQDLANFTESILLPVPLTLWILFLKYLSFNLVFAWICFGFGLLFFGTLSFRYLHLRTFWVKHTYRAFLAEKHQTNE